MRHPLERREKLRLAGMSEGTELRPNEIEAIDGISLSEAEHMTSAGLRNLIIGGTGMTKRKREHPTIREEAVRILRAEGPMHYGDLADRIVQEGRAKPRGKTFKQTLSAELARRAGRGEDVERVAPGVYAAKEEA